MFIVDNSYECIFCGAMGRSACVPGKSAGQDRPHVCEDCARSALEALKRFAKASKPVSQPAEVEDAIS